MTGKETIDEGQLLGRLLSSTTKGELLILFHGNPGLIDTVEGVALRLGKKPKMVKEDLADLVEIGALGKKEAGVEEVYFLNREKDKQIMDRVAGQVKDIKA
jgi:hypothetical protein